MGYSLEVLTTSFLSSLNLLEWLTELRETLINSQMKRYGEWWTRFGERRRRFHALSRHMVVPASPSIHQPRSSPNLWGFIEVSLHSRD